MRLYITGLEENIRKIERVEELAREIKDLLRDLYFYQEIKSEPRPEIVLESKENKD